MTCPLILSPVPIFFSPATYVIPNVMDWEPAAPVVLAPFWLHVRMLNLFIIPLDPAISLTAILLSSNWDLPNGTRVNLIPGS